MTLVESIFYCTLLCGLFGMFYLMGRADGKTDFHAPREDDIAMEHRHGGEGD